MDDEKVECPMCSKLFDVMLIENHASYCDGASSSGRSPTSQSSLGPMGLDDNTGTGASTDLYPVVDRLNELNTESVNKNSGFSDDEEGNMDSLEAARDRKWEENNNFASQNYPSPREASPVSEKENYYDAEPVQTAAELLQIEKSDLYHAFTEVGENILRWPSVIQFEALPIALRGATLMIPGEDTHTEEFITRVLPTVFETFLSQNWSYQTEAKICLRYLVELAVARIPFDCHVSLDLLTSVFNDSENFFWLQRGVTFDPTVDPAGDFARPATVGISAGEACWTIDNVNHFGQVGGFDAVIARLQEEDRPASLATIRKLLAPLSMCAKYLREGRAANVLTQLHALIITRLENISDETFRGLSFAYISDTIKELRLLVDRGNVEQLRALDRVLLSLALRGINSGALEKQINGLTEIKTVCNHATWPSLSNTGSSSSYGLTDKELIVWLGDNRILHRVFRVIIHEELVKRCSEILQFLCRKNALTNEDLDMIWESSVGKHEAIVTSVQAVLRRVVFSLSSNQLDYLFDRFGESYKKHKAESTLQMIQELAKEDESYREGLMATKALDLLWDLCQDDAGLDSDTVALATRHMIEILNATFKDSKREQYAEKCVSNIREGHSVASTVMVLTQIIQLDNKCRQHGIMGTMSSIGHNLVREHTIQNLIVANLASYMTEARRVRGENGGMSIAAQWGREHEIDAIENTIFTGRHSHAHQISVRLDFLLFLLPLTNSSLDPELVDMIWDSLVRDPVCVSDTERCLHFFSNCHEERLLHPSVQTKFFTEKLCLLPVRVLEAGFGCFEQFFVSTNVLLGKISPKKKVVDPENLVGLQALWNITLNCVDPEVVSKSRRFLVLVHVILSPEVRDKAAVATRLVDGLFERLFKAVEESNGSTESREVSEQKIERLLLLLNNLMDHRDTDTSHKLRMGLSRPFWVSLVLPDEHKVEWRVHADQTVRAFHILVAKTLGVASDEMTMVFEGERLDEWDLTLDQAGVHDRALIHAILPDDFASEQFIATQSEESPRRGSPVKGYSSPSRGGHSNNGVQSPQRGSSKSPTKRRTVSTADDEPILTSTEAGQPEVVISLPDTLSSSYREHYDILFELSKHQGVQIRNAAWSVLMSMPTNPDLLSDLLLKDDPRSASAIPNSDERDATEPSVERTASAGSESDETSRNRRSSSVTHGATAKASLDKWLDVRSVSRILYTLQVIDTMLCPLGARGLNVIGGAADGGVGVRWVVKFVDIGGLASMLRLVTDPDFEKGSQCCFRVMCINAAMRIIQFLIWGDAHGRGILGKASHSSSAHVDAFKFIEEVSDTFIAGAKGDTSSDYALSKILDRPTLSVRLNEIILLCAENFFPRHIPPDEEYDHESLGQQVSALSCTALALWARCVFSRQLLPTFLADSRTPSFLRTVILASDHSLREQSLLYFCDLGLTNSEAGALILNSALTLLPEAELNSCRCEQMFSLVNHLLENARGEMRLSSEQIKKLISEQVDRIAEMAEANIARDEALLVGHLTVTKQLFVIDRNVSAELSPAVELIDVVFRLLLFRENGAESICSSQYTRQHAFNLLVELVEERPDALYHLFQLIRHNHAADEYHDVWDFQPSAGTRPEHGLVGLRNLGATCYMNSLFQQLFMMPQLRGALLSIPEREGGSATSVLYQFQRMLAYLQESKMAYYDTTPFVSVFTVDGQPVNPAMQQDAEEFFNLLCDKIETELKGQPEERMAQQVFGGKLSNQVISSCGHISETDVDFRVLTVEVKGKENLSQSLEALISSEVLEGDNAYFCSVCQEKRTAKKRQVLNALPDVLIVHLKRFEFDFDEMRRVKVNTKFQFPQKLDLTPYTKEYLMRHEADDGMSVKSSSTLAPSGVKYQLQGVLVHSGSAEGGHYYSFIKNGDVGWFKFDDKRVTNFDPQEIQRECFGGDDVEEEFDKWTKSYYSRRTEKIRSAYMLFYTRADKRVDTPVGHFTPHPRPSHFTDDDPPSPSSVHSAASGASAATETYSDNGLVLKLSALLEERQHFETTRDAIPDSIAAQISEDNARLTTDCRIFDPLYFQFVPAVINRAWVSQSDLAIRFAAAKTASLFLTRAYLHAQPALRSKMVWWGKSISSWMMKDVRVAELFLRLWGEEEGVLKSMLISSGDLDVAAFASKIIYQALNITNHFRTQAHDLSAWKKMAEALVNLLRDEVPMNFEYSTAVFELFITASSIGSEIRCYFIELGLVSILVDLILWDESPMNKSTTARKRPRLVPKGHVPQFHLPIQILASVLIDTPSLPPDDESMLLFPEALDRFVEECQKFPVAALPLLQSIIQIHPPAFQLIYELALPGITGTPMKYLDGHLALVRVLLTNPLCSDAHLNTIMITLLHTMRDNATPAGHPKRAFSILKFIQSLLTEASEASRWLLRRKKEWSWAVEWLDRETLMSRNYSVISPLKSNSYSDSHYLERTGSTDRTLKGVRQALEREGEGEGAGTSTAPPPAREISSEDSNSPLAGEHKVSPSSRKLDFQNDQQYEDSSTDSSDGYESLPDTFRISPPPPDGPSL